MVRMHFRVTSLVMIAVMSSMTILIQTSMASSLEEQKESLKIIADFAERLCNDIPLKGQGSNLELTGKAKAELNWILKRLVNLGVEGAVKYQDTKYEGLLQKDLVRALKDSTDCKLKIWKDFKKQLFGPENNSRSDPPDPCAKYVPPNSDYVNEIWEQAEKDANTPPWMTKFLKESMYGGYFQFWVAKCGKDGFVYERDFGSYRSRIVPKAVYTDSEGRECRKLQISTKREGRWSSSSDIFCRVQGEWRPLH